MKAKIFEKIYWLIIANSQAVDHDDVDGSIFTCGEIQGLVMALEAMDCVVTANNFVMQNGCDYFEYLCVDDEVLFSHDSLVGLVNAV